MMQIARTQPNKCLPRAEKSTFYAHLTNLGPQIILQIRNQGLGGRMCLDSPVGRNVEKKTVSLYPCHGQGGNQVLDASNTALACLPVCDTRECSISKSADHELDRLSF